MDNAFINISSDQLRKYLSEREEDQYVLIDVRQPDEYARSHLPGALLLPLADLPGRLDELPLDKDLIFYCRSGRRSQAAATFACARPYYDAPVYNLSGGILAWKGRAVKEIPNTRVIALDTDIEGVLYQAMDMERGAYLFYSKVLEIFPDELFSPAIEMLAEAEVGHAKMIYSYWSMGQDQPQDFVSLYSGLKGEILEDGHSLASLMDQITHHVSSPCRTILEMALTVEYAAYDLYRTMAHMWRGREMEEMLLSIAQAEKEHMRIAAEAMAHCR